ncbi:unnamed protein product, partial [Rotaria socialis]
LLQLERRDFYEIQYSQEKPASTRFIASFRQAQENSNRRVIINMDVEHVLCVICLNYLTTDQHYSQWPCSGNRPHLFHYKCMLDSLRTRNTCPLCRHEVEPAPAMLHQNIIQIIRRVFFLNVSHFSH